MGTGADGVLKLLSRRERLIRELCDEPHTKQELVGSLECSRSTIDRALRRLVDERLVEHDGGTYRLTLQGSLAFAEFERFSNRVSGVLEASDVLDVLPADCGLDAIVFESATVVEANRTAPHEPLETYLDDVRRADSVRALGSVVIPQYVQTFRDRLVDGGMEGTFVLESAAIEHLVVEHRSTLAEVVELDRFSLREVETTPPFSLVLFEIGDSTRLGVLVYVIEGVRGYVATDDPEAVDWGETLFDRHLVSGTEISDVAEIDAG